ncbi:MAG TPA: dihydroorotase, partial [Firmicutes bacterium]|nr:dihydroorotase [Bacillota bacterium]
GMIGLETAFPLAIEHLVRTEMLAISALVEKMCVNPAKILGINAGSLSEGSDADIVIADIDAEVEITKDFFESKSSNSPFIGSRLHGKVETVIKNGKIIVEPQPEDEQS